MQLRDMPLKGLATYYTPVAGTGRGPLTISDLQPLGVPAVVGLTDHQDFLTRDLLRQVHPVACDAPHVRFIVQTRAWFRQGERGQVFSLLSSLAKTPNVLMGLVCDRETGFVNSRGVTVCWDYSSGCPAMADHRLPIGVDDWWLWARQVCDAPQDEGQWREFG